VVIKNKPFAKKFLGAQVAGPVFKEVADKLMSLEKDLSPGILASTLNRDSGQYYYAGSVPDMRQIAGTLNIVFRDSANRSGWGKWYSSDYQPVLNEKIVQKNLIPDLKGMGLKDALYLLENMHLKVAAKGVGKVKNQSLLPGTPFTKNQTLTLELD
jgi:cell division protein FtsI (penicillin-binding protein 3)